MRVLGILALAGCGRLGFGDVASRDGNLEAPATYRQAVLDDHPVGYWRLGDSGATVRDELGQLDGTIVGGVMRGKPGALAGDADTATGFDGLTGKIQLPDQFPFTGTAPFTLEAWVNVPSPASYGHYLTKETRTPSTPIDGYAILQLTDTYFERVIGQTGTIAGNVSIPPLTWTHVVGVYDGSQLAMYIDGQQAGATVTDTRPMPAYSSPLLIGAHVDSANIDGTLDEVALYDHALPPDRIALHHQLAINPP